MSNPIDETKAKDEYNEKRRLKYHENKDAINEYVRQYRTINNVAHNEKKRLYRKKIKDAKEHEEIICEFLANIVN
jgi:hypothetical protein